MYIMNFGLGLW